MKFGYIIVIVLLLLSASFFGAYFGTQKTVVVEKKEIVYVPIEKIVPYIEPSPVINWNPISVVPTPNKKFEGRWGGIASSKNVYPVGTTYNAHESGLYGVPVATGHDFSNRSTTNVYCGEIKCVSVPMGEEKWYIFLDGYWFTREEYNKLPYEVRVYKYSPYSISD